jgi:hypothetical protein
MTAPISPRTGRPPEALARLLRLRAAREAYLLNGHIAALLNEAADFIEEVKR